MTEHIQMQPDGRVSVSSEALTQIVAAFTREHTGNYTGLEIVTLALMTGIQVGYKVAKDEND